MDVENTEKGLPIVQVASAVICDSREKNKIFATQRGVGDMKGGWEFPGGELLPGENFERALVREVREELNVKVIVGKYIGTVEHDFPNFHLTMKCYYAYIESGKMVFKEHMDSKWLSKDELDTVDWLSVDKDLLDIIRKDMK